MATKYSKKASEKIARVMREFEHGTLKSHGRKVTSRQQAKAIALSEARAAGYKVPPERSHSSRGAYERAVEFLRWMNPGQEVDAEHLARSLRISKDAAARALKKASAEGIAATDDGEWFSPARARLKHPLESRAGRHHSTRPTQADIDREAARARTATPRASVTAYSRGPYVDEAHINVTTMVGDLAGSHFAVYDALKAVGIKPARISAGSFKLTVDEELSLSKAKSLVVATLRDAGIEVRE